MFRKHPAQTSMDSADVDAFLAHARWLMEFHSDRSRVASSRALGLLGFIGVLLGLLVTSGSPVVTGHGGLVARMLALIAGGLLVLAGFICIGALAPMASLAPSVKDARKLWSGALMGQRRGKAGRDVAEQFLNAGTGLAAPNPLEAASDEASRRIKFLKGATLLLVFALLFLFLSFLFNSY